MTSHPAIPLSAKLHAFLSSRELSELWRLTRARLERNGHEVTGTIQLDLDEPAAVALSGLLGRHVRTGTTRLRLSELDSTLRASSAAAGLVSVATTIGGPLADRPAARAAAIESRQRVWDAVDATLASAALAAAPWVPAWIAGLRRGGTLTRPTPEVAIREVSIAVRALELLANSSAPRLRTNPATSEASDDTTEATSWELAELASTSGGDAHALDGDRLASLLALRAAAAADNTPAPSSAAERRAAWVRLGVAPDILSGTVLVWNLRPPGAHPWPAMMNSRADLDLVTHLTVAELAAVDVPLVEPGMVVWCCENPQVMQAAARERMPGTLVCLSGNPSSAGVTLLEHLQCGGAAMRYHGDFDWPGVAIAARIFRAGAAPWRMGESDYRRAVKALPEGSALPLSGRRSATIWDPGLALAMTELGVAVHEESLLDALLSDLQ